MKHTFYRIAHKVTSRGVYSHNNYCLNTNIPDTFCYEELEDMSYRHSYNINKTPCLNDDSFVSNSTNYSENYDRLRYINENSDMGINIYCFNSITQLKNWFTDDELSLLDTLDFHIIVFELDDNKDVYREYRHQCITPLPCFLSSEVDIMRIVDVL